MGEDKERGEGGEVIVRELTLPAAAVGNILRDTNHSGAMKDSLSRSLLLSPTLFLFLSFSLSSSCSCN